MNINSCLLFVFGGVKFSENTNKIDLISLIRWNIVVIIPIISSVLYIVRECKILSNYTLIRYGFIVKWWKNKVYIIILNNIFYVIVGISIIIVFNINSLEQVDLKLLVSIFIIFSLFIVCISLICSTIIILKKNIHLLFIIYILLVGLCSIIGILKVENNKISFGCFGMILRSNYYNNFYGFSFFTIIIFMIVLIIINISFVSLYLKNIKNKCYRRL